MASKKRQSTPWKPALWERVYRGETLWVEEMFSRSPKWSWQTNGPLEGRAKTRLSAMDAAERAVDAAWESESKAEAK